MEAHKGKISKMEAMTKHVDAFKAHFLGNDACEEKRKQICQQVAVHGPAIQQLAGSNIGDPATNQFFMQLSQAQMELQML